MLPDWFSTVVMTGSLAAIRVICCISENGRAMTDADGRRVITARLSYKELRRDCRMGPTTLSSALRLAQDRGWLSVSSAGSHGFAAIYSIPVSLPAAGNRSYTDTETVSEPDTKNVSSSPDIDTENVSGIDTENVSEPGPAETVSSSRGPAMKDSPGDEPESDTESVSEGDTEPVVHYGGGDDGSNREITKSNLNTGTPHHHHHDADLIRILESYGFNDTEEFLDKHHPDRVRAAVAHVESLKGVKNRGGMIRRTVERPGGVTSPYNPIYAGPLGRKMAGYKEYYAK